LDNRLQTEFDSLVTSRIVQKSASPSQSFHCVIDRIVSIKAAAMFKGSISSKRSFVHDAWLTIKERACSGFSIGVKHMKASLMKTITESGIASDVE
jgi:hypothetical protein